MNTTSDIADAATPAKGQARRYSAREARQALEVYRKTGSSSAAAAIIGCHRNSIPRWARMFDQPVRAPGGSFKGRKLRRARG